MTNWQPIETAPKDGSLIWLWVGDSFHIGYFDIKKYWGDVMLGVWVLKTVFDGRGSVASCCHTCKDHEQPTLWQPLPEPPHE